MQNYNFEYNISCKSFTSVSFPVVAGGSALIFVASATALSPLVTASLGVLGIGKIY